MLFSALILSTENIDRKILYKKLLEVHNNFQEYKDVLRSKFYEHIIVVQWDCTVTFIYMFTIY
jgi:hypothetical protein